MSLIVSRPSSVVPHIPVLLHEVIRMLDPRPGEFFVDGTINGGGHSAEILKKVSPSGMLLGIDWDSESLKRLEIKYQKSRLRPASADATALADRSDGQANLKENIRLICENYANLPEILQEERLPKIDGLLLDLGFSSEQIEMSGRGFSFAKDEPLLMTYSDSETPVRDLLPQLSEQELTRILKVYGEERFAHRIAHAIKETGRKKKIETSGELAEIILVAIKRRGRLHPATQTFQALRIYANHELENIGAVISALPRVMNHNGRVAIISFHSLEDRIVKTSFKQFEKDGIAALITKKPITPTNEETKENPRSRSAKLRGVVFR